MKRVRRIARGVLRIGVPVGFVALGASLVGSRWESSEERAFDGLGLEPQGRVVEVGGSGLHVVAEGSHGPPVLFISGLGDDGRSWTPLLRLLPDSLRTVRYDRPGLGWSPARETLPTLATAVEDVHALLADPGLFAEPAILVGHSYGGSIAREVALQYPSEVAALLLLDPTPINAMSIGFEVAGRVVYQASRWAGTVGLSRWRLYSANPEVDRRDLLVAAHLGASARASRGALREYLGAVESTATVIRDGALGDLPLTVMSSPIRLPPGLRGTGRAMVAGRQGIGRESGRGRYVETSTGHYVHWDDPEAVAAELLDLVAASDGGPRGWAAHDFTGLKVRLQTADLATTVAFYRDVLGLEVVDQWSEEGDAGVIFGLEDAGGSAFLEFGVVASPDNGAASVQLRVEDMARFLRRLGDVWPLDGPHERPWGSVYSYLRDPNGVQVVVFEETV